MLGSDIPVSATLIVEDGELRGTLDISSRRIENLAFTAEVFPDGRIRFVIPDQDPPLTFDGMLEDDVISGTFRVGIIGGSFILERAGSDS